MLWFIDAYIYHNSKNTYHQMTLAHQLNHRLSDLEKKKRKYLIATEIVENPKHQRVGPGILSKKIALPFG